MPVPFDTVASFNFSNSLAFTTESFEKTEGRCTSGGGRCNSSVYVYICVCVYVYTIYMACMGKVRINDEIK